ncbi:MAG: FAD-dependent oxidoreductase [Arenicellaceae bacterium]|nr:FAD-dependent oxidoreductase [Arenicellaceae bacterium]
MKKKPTSFDANLIVIGAGSAGLVSSYIAAAVKAKVILIERHKMGGDCLNTGCVPSKAILRSAKIAEYMRRAPEFGLTQVKVEPRFEQVMARVKQVMVDIEPHDSVDRYTRLGVDCIVGEAKIISPWKVQVDSKLLTARAIIIASGARPVVPSIEGLAEAGYLTSDSVWSLTKLPKKFVVLGGGAIGCELGQAFSRLGSEVTIVERLDRLLVKEDIEVGQVIEQSLMKSGVKCLTKHEATRVIQEGARKVLVCVGPKGEVEVPFNKILVTVGRSANIENTGIEALGIKTQRNGAIKTDKYMRTSVKSIYACGDVVGPYQFTHVAAHQAWYASVNALFGTFKKFSVDYRVIPWAIFTDPEVAHVGLSEQDAEEQAVPFEISRYGIDGLDRAITDGESYGFVKVLTVPGKDRILGVTIVGHHAAEVLTEFVLAMKHNLGLSDILSTIHLYPSFAESNKYAAGVWKRAHQPERLLNWVQRFHTWRRG